MKVVGMIAVVLAAVGALNWGLVGLGMILNTELNVINLLLGSVPVAEYVVYLLIGVSGIMLIFAHGTKKCHM